MERQKIELNLSISIGILSLVMTNEREKKTNPLLTALLTFGNI